MKNHIVEIRKRMQLPESAVCELITSKLTHDKMKYYKQFVYKVFSNGDEYRLIVTEASFKHYPAEKNISVKKMHAHHWFCE